MASSCDNKESALPQADILRDAPLVVRLQKVIDDFHVKHPSHEGPVVYALHTGHARLHEEIFAQVTWPHEDSHVFLMSDHKQILWSLNHPFFVFQNHPTHLRAPDTHRLALEKTRAARRAWRDRFQHEEKTLLLAFARKLDAVAQSLSSFYATSTPTYTGKISLLDKARRNVSFISNLDAGGAERQAMLMFNGMVAAKSDEGTDFHTLSYLPGGKPPLEQFFGPSLNVTAAALHDITTVDIVRAPYLVAEALGKPYSWGADVEAQLLRRLGNVEPGLVNIIARFFWALVPLRPRVVFCWQDYMNTIGGLAACLAGAEKVVLGGRNVAPDVMGFKQSFFKEFYQTLLSDPRVEMRCNAHAGAASYAQWLEVPTDQIKVVHNAFVPPTTPQEAADPLGILQSKNSKPPIIIGVFKLRSEKDPELFLDTVSLVQKSLPDLRVFHLGDGPLFEDFKASVRKRNLTGVVTVLGLRNDVSKWMQQGDIMLHTALTEGLPNVFLEAQYAGLPIVTTKAGGTAEAMIPGITGDELTQRDPHVLAERVLMRLSDKTWRDNARSAGPEFVQREFSFDKILAQTMSGLDL
jgi:glycosyltransferase involved in cell wall biosynthesis